MGERTPSRREGYDQLRLGAGNRPPRDKNASRDTKPEFQPVPDPAPLPSVLTDHILGLDEEEPGTEAVASDSPEIAQVQRLVRTWDKAIKAVRLYPMESPVSVRFTDALMQALTETFRLMDAIRLTVGKSKFFFTNEVVLDAGDREDSVPARLFWDGIREITFHMGVTRREVTDFLGLFRKNAMSAEQGEDDIVTLLWEGDFTHITHIAIDDILDLENADDPIPEEFGREFMNYVDLEMHDLDDEEAMEAASNQMAEEVRAKLSAEDNPDLFVISEEERAALSAELAEEDSPKLLHDVVRVIYETLLLEEDENDFVNLARVLSGAMLGLIGEGRLREAGEVIRMFRDLRERVHLGPRAKAVVVSALETSWDETRREAIVHHLDSGRAGGVAAFSSFLDALPPEAVRPLCEILGDLETRRARRVLVDSLIEKAKGNIHYFKPFLQDERWFLVRNVAHILGATGNEQAVEPLEKLLAHPDSRVRREALTALSRIGTRKALVVLEQALYDDDSRIRVGAARNLAVVGRRALPALLTVIEEKGFERKDLSEKRAFYEALAFTGGKDVLPLLREILSRRGMFFRRNQTDEMRACACEALGWIGGPEAKELLNRHLQDRSVLVRTAAQSGLRRAAGDRSAESIVKEAA